jgi:hypothetical protein
MDAAPMPLRLNPSFATALLPALMLAGCGKPAPSTTSASSACGQIRRRPEVLRFAVAIARCLEEELRADAAPRHS